MADISIARIARRGFGGVFDPRGRDDRPQYWLFLLLVFGPLIVVQMVVPMALTFSSIDLTGASASVGPQASLDAMEPQFRAMATAAYVGIGLYLLGASLLLTATARRLHDRGHSGWWAMIMPLALYATTLGQARHTAEMADRMPQVMAEMEKKTEPTFPNVLTLSAKMQASSSGPDWLAILGGLILLGLVVELARAGTAGPNRFGPPSE